MSGRRHYSPATTSTSPPPERRRAPSLPAGCAGQPLNLRDQLKGLRRADGSRGADDPEGDGTDRPQEIPQIAIDIRDRLDPETNAVAVSPQGREGPRGALRRRSRAAEPDERYGSGWRLKGGPALRPYSRTIPPYIDRRFNLSRRIPEAQVKALSDGPRPPSGSGTGRLIRQAAGPSARSVRRLVRGVQPRPITESELDALTKKRYRPRATEDMPDLPDLGFRESSAL